MGLDMFLYGRKHLMGGETEEDGFTVIEKRLGMGYWRKHPNLHGYIVDTFGKGIDECQEIDLGPEDVERIIEAIKKKELPNTEGFFFGTSKGTEEEDQQSINVFQKALEWLNTPCNNQEFRTIYYQASW